VGEHLFHYDGVYGTHAYFSSVLQALTIKAFGANGAAWRISNPYLCALAVGLFYSFFRTFVTRDVCHPAGGAGQRGAPGGLALSDDV
jgi:hypothetical protein